MPLVALPECVGGIYDGDQLEGPEDFLRGFLGDLE